MQWEGWCWERWGSGGGGVWADASQTVSTDLALRRWVDLSLSCRNKVHHNPAVFGDDWRWWEHRSEVWVRCVSGQRGPKDKITDGHASRYSEAHRGGGGLGGLVGMLRCWHQQRQSNPHRAPRATKGGREEEEREGQGGEKMEGGGDKDGGTTLVIGSLATVGWVDVINRNCTCSREPLMALNLHQAWTGG